MRADEALEYGVDRECVLWQRSEISMAIMLDAGRQDKDWDADYRLEIQRAESEARNDGFRREQCACRYPRG